jgi:hypothetical protein
MKSSKPRPNSWIFFLNAQNATNRRTVRIVGCITLGSVIIDYILGTFFDIFKDQLTSNMGLVIFSAISILLYSIGQYYLLGFVRKISKDVKMAGIMNKIATITQTTQYILLAILLMIVTQMVLLSQYSLGLFLAATALGTLPGVIIYAILGLRLLSWYKSNKAGGMVLLLGLAASTGAIAMSGNIVFLVIIVSEKPSNIDIQTQVDFSHISSSEILNTLFFSIVVMMAIISSMFQWAGIAAMMRHLSTRIGKIKYWMIVCLPACALLAGVAPSLFGSPTSDFGLYTESKVSFRVLTVIGSLSLQAIWGLGYLSIAKGISKVNKNSPIINYMTATAFGIMLTGFAFASPVIFVTYPPFGLAGHSYLTLAAYLFSFGFYSSAISIAQDVKLRQSIRKLAVQESKLIDNIGKANFEQQIEKKVLSATKAQLSAMTNETGVKAFLTEEDVKGYLDQVLKEINREKDDKSNNPPS